MVEIVLFLLFGALAILGALTVILARNPVYSALGLMGTMFSLAVLYVVHLAHFIAAVQVIVYAGAVMTLFLFVIMLIGVDRAEDTSETLPNQKRIVIGLGLAAFIMITIVVMGDSFTWVIRELPEDAARPNGSIQEVGRVLFGIEDPEARTVGWSLPFEAVSLLLVIAALGAIGLAFFRPLSRKEND